MRPQAPPSAPDGISQRYLACRADFDQFVGGGGASRLFGHDRRGFLCG
jgi:hypothetical protein